MTFTIASRFEKERTLLNSVSSGFRLLPRALIAVFFFSAFSCHSQSVSTPQPSGPAATFDLDKDRALIVSLDGPWRRQIGDNPAWANPAFDDSSWPIVRPDQPWSEQQFSGTVWYRAKIRVPAHSGPLELYLFYIDDSYQVFVDGALLRSAGALPPHPHAYGIPPSILSLPPSSAEDQPYTLTIAIRVWLSPDYSEYHQGGLSPGSSIGSPPLIQTAYHSQITSWAWNAVNAILLAILFSLAALTALTLFYFRRKETEYLWFALTVLAFASTACFGVYYQFHTLGVNEAGSVIGLFAISESFTEIAFYYRLLKGKRDWLFWIAIASNLAALVFTDIPGYFGLVGSRFSSAFVTAIVVPGSLWILVLLLRRARQGFPDARLLLVPFLLSRAASIIGLARWVLFSFNIYRGPADWYYHTLSWPFNITLSDLGDFLFLIAMLAILISRFTRTRLNEEAYEHEREAARTVQQLLIPQDVPVIPGLLIRSVYKPYGEVGGDFFQIFPISNGSVLVILGDVSGKGLPAAMAVTLIVGSLRQAVQFFTRPAVLMQALNCQLAEHSSGGFTTCLILRADPDGTLAIANAGHIPPYQNGIELQIENGLPLGLLAEATYTESNHHFSPSDQLSLVTDGVLEARSKSGELYGFDRTQAISRQSAESIADAAQQFGQDDDITVLTITRI